jgi:hypothetical protein
MTAIEQLEQKHRENQIRMDITVQEAKMRELDRMLALDASRRSLGSAGSNESLESLYNPEDYVDIYDYRRDNYGYQAHGATYTTNTDRQDGRNWPYWVSEPELAAIRGTVRLICTYNKTCIGILNKLRNYTVGHKGFVRKVVSRSKNKAHAGLLRAIELVLDEFDVHNSITGDLDQEAIVRDIRDGELGCGLWHRGNGIVDLRVVEPDQISEPTNQEQLEEWLCTVTGDELELRAGLPFDSNWSFGIHSTKGDVALQHGYYVQWDGTTTNWDYLPGGNYPCYPPANGLDTWMVLMKSNTDRNIKRGVGDFWPVSGDMELCRKLIRNLSHAGALQSALAWIREMTPGITQPQVESSTMSAADWVSRVPTQSGGTRTSYHTTYQPGTTLYLGAGQKFVPPPWMHQGVAGAMVGVFEAMMRSIGVIWSMPEHMITGSAANNNYASILESGSPFVKEVETRQERHIKFWTNIYWRVVWFAWRSGRLGRYSWMEVKRTIDVILTGPQVDVRERGQETSRNELLFRSGIISPIEWASREGIDYDEQVSQGAKPQQQAGPPGVGHPGIPSMGPAQGEAQEACTDEARRAEVRIDESHRGTGNLSEYQLGEASGSLWRYYP